MSTPGVTTTGVTTTGVTTTGATATGAPTAGAPVTPVRADHRPDGPRPPAHALPRPRRYRPAPRPGADPARAPRDHHHPYRIAEEPHP
ncbi:hypothetical protein [Streptomyces sp. NPDC051577]|uniref:hypothetical protein n=1 Tax=Streptomyces sp. NPDC051577 TaxID=3155166 RepID=UPI00341C2252